MTYTPDLARPVIVPRGQSITRTLAIYSGTGDATVTGSYALYDRSESSVATGTVTAGSVAVSVPGSLELGAGAYEVWTLSAPLVVEIRRPVFVSRSLDSRFNLVSTPTLQAVRSWLSLGYPAGRSSWEYECEAATIEVLRALVGRTVMSATSTLDIWDPSPLAAPALLKALETIYRGAHAMTGASHFLDEATRLAAEYEDWWERAPLAWGDSTGVGPDTLPGPPAGVGFPRPGPAGGR